MTETPFPTDPAALWAELRPQLLHIGTAYPHAAVARLRAAREAVAPLLVAELETLADDPAAAIDDPDYILHLHLLTLLAEFRETRAYPAMLRLATRGEEEGEALFGDFATETLGRCLASVCAGVFEPLCVLADDAAVGPWLRSAALEALTICCLEGDAPQDDVVAHIEAVGKHEAERQLAVPPAERDDAFMGSLTVHLTAVGGLTALPSVREWFRHGLVDPSMCGDIRAVEQDLGRPLAESAASMRKWDKGYLRDAEKELANWAMFQPKPASPPAPSSEHYLYDDVGQPYVRNQPKVGRNDPCPCGSGKKYKKCCGRDE